MALSEDDRSELQRILAHPLEYPEKFKGWFPDWIATNIPKIPISQVFGFKIDQAKVADEIATTETVSATSYGDLATAGPTLTQLHDGYYIVMFGMRVTASTAVGATDQAFMSLSLNGSTPSDNDSAAARVNNAYRTVLVHVQNNHNNTIKAQYRRTSGTGTLQPQRRFLAVLRVVDADA